MCVIIYKSKKRKLSLEEIRAAFDTNSHGAGYMWRHAGHPVHIRKGFMTCAALEEDLAQHNFLVGDELTDKVDMALHFRIATSGGVCPERTHPFPISKSYTIQEKLIQQTDAALMHNGVISGMGGVDWSDTQEVVSTSFYHVFQDGMEATVLRDILDATTPVSFFSSKFLIMTPAFTYWLGEFIQEEGLFYSNLNDRKRMNIRTTYYEETSKSVDNSDVINPKQTLTANAILDLVRKHKDWRLLPHIKLLNCCFESDNCITCKFFKFRKAKAMCTVWRRYKDEALQYIPELSEFIQTLEERLNAAHTEIQTS